MKMACRLLLGLAASTAFTGPGMAAVPAASAPAPAAPVYALHIPPGTLEAALVALADATGLQLLYTADLARGLSSPGMSGSVTAQDGLAGVLAGTGLRYRFLNARTVTIERPSAMRTLGPVRVEGVSPGGFAAVDGFGAGAGANGSSDPTATEGTGSLTTNGASVASKIPQALKDTPQSVTVLTQERIQQQVITDYTAALNDAPGITLQQTNSIQTNFYSRGFGVSAFQVDGGAPLDPNVNTNYVPTLNLAEYDNVQVLRGSDALFGGAGQPGGVVSLTRKLPLDHDQLTFDINAGSFNNFRGQTDATGPLGFDGHLRGRLVLEYQDRDFFYDVAHQNKAFVYGVMEADLGEDTLLRFGGSYEKQDNSGWDGTGLPRTVSGADLGLKRSTCLCAPWNRWGFKSPELFVALQHQFSPDWQVKLNATDLMQRSNRKEDYSYGQIQPGAETSQPYTEVSETNFNNRLTQYALDATLSGSFQLLGYKQKLAIGMDYSRSQGPSSSGGAELDVPINVFAFDPTSLNPAPPPAPIAESGKLIQEQSGAYATLNLQILDPVHVTGGLRLSNYRIYIASTEYNTPSDQVLETSTNAEHTAGVLTPYAGITYDLTKQITLYASYADIFQSQAEFLSPSGAPLPPVTGTTYEAGAKGLFNGGRLNVSAAFYYTQESNLGIYDPGATDPGNFSGETTGSFCCYLNQASVTSKGVDLEVSGALMPGWQVQAGYSFNENAYGAGYANTGSAYQTQQPKHQLKLWTSYVGQGWLKKWTLGGGMRLESARYTSGSVCSIPLEQSGVCAGSYVPFNFTQALYTVIDLRAAYAINTHLQAAVNLTNIADTRYYATAGTSQGENFYGEPRAIMFSLHGSY